MRLLAYLAFLLLSLSTSAQEGEIVDDGCRVSVLGYHVFHSTQSASQMRIPTSKFRTQMQVIKDSGIPVITLDDFLKWRRNESTIPPQSILITMDDGWRSVYSEAFPVMKELQLPFTIFLYKNYVGSERGGRALSLEMIGEMTQSGLCQIGSHSVSHPFPSSVKAEQKKGPENYEAYLKKEFGESKTFLEKTFEKEITTYAYPGGYHTPEMFQIADELGYDHLFTVKPGKVSRLSPHHTLPRYIVLGNDDRAFEAAMAFRNRASATAISTVDLPFEARPNPGSLVGNRTPKIRLDLSSIENLDTDSLELRVAGFGQVPLQVNPETKIAMWTVSRPLRLPVCELSLKWRLQGKTKFEPVKRWSFRIDHAATYRPKT